MPARDVSAAAIIERLAEISPVAKHWDMQVLEAEQGMVHMAMTVRADMTNTQGNCHGGVIFSLADFCFGFAANSYNDRAVAASCDIKFLKPAAVGDRLFAKTAEIWKQGRSGLYDVTVTNQDGETIAVLRGHSRLVGGRHIEGR
ncbi:MAG: hydroxyphenylacetyl-CoA thioesterase PaaI [Hyphomicrobiales bacterium]|nr:hydroxyphenylacetyl-CoA thioesterase PaaI [Hyphomicrobiales bacterium]